MTNEEAINVLTLDKENWERLIREHIAEQQEGNEMVEALGKAIKALKNVRPHGEWETVYHTYPFVGEEVQYCKLDIVRCNFCGTVREGRVNFCSSCGADMREADE